MKNVSSNDSRQRPGYYATIPATVRYDPALPQGAKLLYGEITALASMTGVCWSTNAYFARLYNTSLRTIKYWIASLHNKGYIIVWHKYFKDSKKIERRYIKLAPPQVRVTKRMPEEEDDQDDETGILPPEPDDLGYENDTIYGGAKNCPTQNMVVQKTAPPSGAKNCTENITSKNIAAAAAISQNLNDIKTMFLKINKELVFDSWFYKKALDHLERFGLDPPGYIAFVLDETKKRKPESLRSMFFTLFFAEDITELYNTVQVPETVPVFITCPACGRSHNASIKECPSCGLAQNHYSDENAVLWQKKFMQLSQDQVENYYQKLDTLSSVNFLEKQKFLENLNREFGLSG